jgi:dihydropteroate synthase
MHPDILEVVAEYGVPYVAMHMRGTPRTMQQDTRYDDVVGEIIEYFAQRLEAVRGHGIAAERIVLDPGIGFGKPPEGNDEILARLGELRQLGYPLLVGPSRKSFLKRFPGGERAEERLPGTLAAVTICALAGVEIVRVHDVAAARQAVALADQVRARTPGGGAP